MSEVRQRPAGKPGARRPPGNYTAAFRADGVIHIPQALSADDLRLVEAAYAWRMANLGPGASAFYADTGATFLQALGDSSEQPVFQRMLRDTPIGDIAADLFGRGPVWYMDEQLFYKDGAAAAGGARRTPWHQDSSYHPYGGTKQAVFWIALDRVTKDGALEVVRGSHLGVRYNGARFDPRDDTAPIYPESALPRLPNIEAERDKWDIVSWAVEPGDLLVFHAAALHGGGSAGQGVRRRSLTLRFAGDDVVRTAQPGQASPGAPLGEGVEAPARPGPRGPAVDRYWALPLGEPVASARPTLVRPWPTK